MDPHEAVSSFVETHGLRTSPEYRILDLVSEVGELAKDVNISSAYGTAPDETRIHEDELGDVLFATYALAYETGIDPDVALESALDKYRTRIDERSDPGSGRD